VGAFAFLEDGLPVISRSKKVGPDFQEAQSDFNRCWVAFQNPLIETGITPAWNPQLRIPPMKLVTSLLPLEPPLFTLRPTFHRFVNAAVESIYLCGILDHHRSKLLALMHANLHLISV